MSSNIDFINCIRNLNISAEKSVIGENLLVKQNFFKKLSTETMRKEDNISVWCDVKKSKMFV